MKIPGLSRSFRDTWQLWPRPPPPTGCNYSLASLGIKEIVLDTCKNFCARSDVIEIIKTHAEAKSLTQRNIALLAGKNEQYRSRGVMNDAMSHHIELILQKYLSHLPLTRVQLLLTQRILDQLRLASIIFHFLLIYHRRDRDISALPLSPSETVPLCPLAHKEEG